MMSYLSVSSNSALHLSTNTINTTAMNTRTTTDSTYSTKSAMEHNAVEQVFGVVELLEMVIANLPYQDIENARLICRHWRETINGSSQLDKKRFLTADPKAGGRDIYVWWNEGRMTPSGHFAPPMDAQSEYPYPDDDIPRPVKTAHPWLEPSTFTADRFWPTPVVQISFPATLEKMLSWPQGRWEEALLMQPPIQEIGIFVRHATADKLKHVKVEDENGLTFGMLVEALRQLVYPRQNLGRATKKQSGPSIDLGNYKEVVGLVKGIMLHNGPWVAQARSFEAEEATNAVAMEAVETAATTGEGQVVRENSDADMVGEAEATTDDSNTAPPATVSKRRIAEDEETDDMSDAQASKMVRMV